MVNGRVDSEFNDSLDRFINQAAQAAQNPGSPIVAVKDYNGDLISRQSGSLSSEMVKRKEKE